MILSYMRTVILYVALIAVIRLMGKRQIGQMEPSEFVVTMLVANLAAIPMQEEDMPLLSGLVPMLIVLIMELTFSYLSMKSIRLRKLLCGKPVILIENGKVIQKNLRRTLVTLDELSGHLRERMCWIFRRYSTPFWRPTAICLCFPIRRNCPPAPETPVSSLRPDFCR